MPELACGPELHHGFWRGEPDDPVQGQGGAKGGSSRRPSALFTYPILQAADILLYEADQVRR